MIEKPQIPHPEEEKKPKKRVLILEDQYSQPAQEAFESLGFEVKVVTNLEELAKIEEEFIPDIVILDINVPEKPGEEPEDYSQKSKEIVQEKFPGTPVFFYTSMQHGERWVNFGVGVEPEEAEIMNKILEELFPDLPEELKDVGDKSNSESWKKILYLVPFMLTQSDQIIEFLKRLPEDLKNEILEATKKYNPALAKIAKLLQLKEQYSENI